MAGLWPQQMIPIPLNYMLITASSIWLWSAFNALSIQMIIIQFREKIFFSKFLWSPSGERRVEKFFSFFKVIAFTNLSRMKSLLLRNKIFHEWKTMGNTRGRFLWGSPSNYCQYRPYITSRVNSFFQYFFIIL